MPPFWTTSPLPLPSMTMSCGVPDLLAILTVIFPGVPCAVSVTNASWPVGSASIWRVPFLSTAGLPPPACLTAVASRPLSLPPAATDFAT